jgi:hypothetical protein
LRTLKRRSFRLHYGAFHCSTLHSTKRAPAATRARADRVQGRARAARGVHEGWHFIIEDIHGLHNEA